VSVTGCIELLFCVSSIPLFDNKILVPDQFADEELGVSQGNRRELFEIGLCYHCSGFASIN